MAFSAVGVCGVAWLFGAAVLVLDLLGRPLARWRRYGVRARRRQMTAGLGMMTGVVLQQVAELRDWPRPLRESLDLTVMFLALVFLACAIATWLSGQAEPQQP